MEPALKLPNTKTSIPAKDGGVISYSQFLYDIASTSEGPRNPQSGLPIGLSPGQIKKRFALADMLEAAKDKDEVEFDKADLELMKAILGENKWKMQRDVVAIHEALGIPLDD